MAVLRRVLHIAVLNFALMGEASRLLTLMPFQVRLILFELVKFVGITRGHRSTGVLDRSNHNIHLREMLFHLGLEALLGNLPVLVESKAFKQIPHLLHRHVLVLIVNFIHKFLVVNSLIDVKFVKSVKDFLDRDLSVVGDTLGQLTDYLFFDPFLAEDGLKQAVVNSRAQQLLGLRDSEARDSAQRVEVSLVDILRLEPLSELLLGKVGVHPLAKHRLNDAALGLASLNAVLEFDFLLLLNQQVKSDVVIRVVLLPGAVSRER